MSSFFKIVVLAYLGFHTLLVNPLMAQIGGRFLFASQDAPQNARTLGMGGITPSLTNADPNMFLQNPALISKESSGQMGLNFTPMFGQANQTSLILPWNLNEKTTIAGAVQYVGYGKFQALDATGAAQGTFTASDFAVSMGGSHQLGNFRIGGNLQWFGSTIETYSANALGLDLGAVFINPKNQLRVGLTVQNIGFVYNDFNGATSSSLPLDVRLGVSYKLQHMPLRFTVTAHHLHQWDIAYVDPSSGTQLDASGNLIPKQKSFGDILLRHFAFGAEFLLSKNFNLRFGYNHLINRELKLDNVTGGAGFSFGAMVKIKGLEFAYSRGIYSVAGAANAISLVYNVQNLFKPKQVTLPETSPAYTPTIN